MASGYREQLEFIAKKCGEKTLLLALAEEAAELAQAALKLRRVVYERKKDPSPVSEKEACENLIEEMADALTAIDAVRLEWARTRGEADNAILHQQFKKARRWEKRIRNAKESV